MLPLPPPPWGRFPSAPVEAVILPEPTYLYRRHAPLAPGSCCRATCLALCIGALGCVKLVKNFWDTVYARDRRVDSVEIDLT